MDRNYYDIRYRKNLWDAEYKAKGLPSSFSNRPSTMLKEKLPALIGKDMKSFLDLGAGMGRNSIYAVEILGFDRAYAIELSEFAVPEGNKQIVEKGLSGQIKLIQQSLGEKIDQEDESFDCAVDMMCMHSMLKRDREVMVNEVHRLVRKGGYMLFNTIAGHSEYKGEKTAYGDLVEKQPAKENGSYYFEHNGFRYIEKGFTEEELRVMFDGFEFISLSIDEKFTPAFGDTYKRLYYNGILQRI